MLSVLRDPVPSHSGAGNTSIFSLAAAAMNRKELIRQYKDTPRPMGVYRVWNPSTGVALVAASTDLPSILNRHRAQLRLGAHPTARLQADWNEHGADALVFEILDTLAPSDPPGSNPVADLIVLEDLWLEKLSLPIDRLHTIRPRRT